MINQFEAGVDDHGSKRKTLEGGIAVPGLIDIHVHGGHGVSLASASCAENLESYSRWAAATRHRFFLSITGLTTIIFPAHHRLR